MTRSSPSDSPGRKREDSDELAIETGGLTNRFGDHVAVDHLEFSVPHDVFQQQPLENTVL
jgi:hypothetical protein